MQKMQVHFSARIALIHAIHGVMQNLHSCHPWQSVAAVKPHGRIHPAPKFHSSLAMVNFL